MVESILFEHLHRSPGGNGGGGKTTPGSTPMGGLGGLAVVRTCVGFDVVAAKRRVQDTQSTWTI